MNAPHDYVRLTKLRRRPLATERGADPGDYLPEGHIMDGWFLQDPAVGHPLAMLRFRRNELCRLGLYSSSLVTHIGETEIVTENSVYRLELRSFADASTL